MTEINKGRAHQLILDANHEMELNEAVRWLVKAVSFLLNRYILND